MSGPPQPRSSQLLRILGVTGAIILGLSVCAGLLVFLVFQNSASPGVWKHTPLYPNARNVRVADFGEDGIRERPTSDVLIMKVITFTVEAPRGDVVSFYRNTFSSGRMEPSDWGRINPPTKDLSYSWTNNARPPSVYFLDLVTRELGPHDLEVEIGVSMFPGY